MEETENRKQIKNINEIEVEEEEEIEYWKKNISEFKQSSNIVLIHVCDENRQITRDFCCKRNILVEHMKYFETFLAENDNGYEDIDISVHCDVEIFEWLMTYIHKPNSPPPLEKALVVSILISSDFLHMEPLVDLCLNQIAQNLGDIIKLPIDLSCISEKLLNRLAALTPSKLLASTRDRKDKILNKLYKRRVELDFSRKSNAPKSLRSIATSLTCCKNCYKMYLDSYSTALVCHNANAAVDFRGKLVRRHESVPDWSLTNYLKTLHGTGGFSWEQIYWHVWSSCIIIRYNEIVFSLSECQRYTLESDGLLILTKKIVNITNDNNQNGNINNNNTTTNITTNTTIINQNQNDHQFPSISSSTIKSNSNNSINDIVFTLSNEDDFDRYSNESIKVQVSDLLSTDQEACDPSSLSLISTYLVSQSFPWGSGLNPFRLSNILCRDIFDLLTSQMKFITMDSQHLVLCESICKTTVLNTLSIKNSYSTITQSSSEFVNVTLQGGIDLKIDIWGNSIENNIGISNGIDEERNRGRSLSPIGRRSRSHGRQAHSTGRKGRTSSIDSSSPIPKEINNLINSTEGLNTQDSNHNNNNNNEIIGTSDNNNNNNNGITNDRRLRSYSSGPQRSNQQKNNNLNNTSGNNSNNNNSNKIPKDKNNINNNINNNNRNSILSTTSAPSNKSSQLNSSSNQNNVDSLIEITPYPFHTLKCFPSNINNKLSSLRGPYCGIWICDHPLSSIPSSYYDTINIINSTSSSTLTDNKRSEWEMDLLREYDCKRMDRYEEYLISCRKNVENQIKYYKKDEKGSSNLNKKKN